MTGSDVKRPPAPWRGAALRHLVAAQLLVALALGATACEVTAEQIQTWKSTEKGPLKLRDALRSVRTPGPLRGQALVALVEIGMLAEAMEDLKAAPQADHREVTKNAVPALIAMARDSGRPATESTKKMRNGKDALFLLREFAAPDDLKVIDEALVEWTTADIEARAMAGSHSTEKILTAIGAPAGERLAAVVLDEEQRETNRNEAARYLGTFGDKAVRARVGGELVTRAEKLPPAGLEDPVLLRIGLLGGSAAVTFLTKLATSGPTSELRAKALHALALAPDPASLPTALALIGDKKAPSEVREAAFIVAEKIGAAAVPGLIGFVDDKEEMVRFRAIEAALAAGRAGAIAPVLGALSPARPYSKDDLRSYLVYQLKLIGPSALPPLREAVKSKSWVARLAAAQALADLGEAKDVALLQTLASDATPLKGWPGGATVGSEARALAAALKAARAR